MRVLLEASDDPTNSEHDPTIDWEELDQRVRRLEPKLERIMGRAFDLDDYGSGVIFAMDEHGQDCAHFADIGVWAIGPEDAWYPAFVVRFSLFGWLFTTMSEHPTERLPNAGAADVVRSVSAAGFRYVPRSALDEPYTGPHQLEERTWWYRFFDYS